MQSSLVLTTFLMGVAGGPHCLAMCGAPCTAIHKTQSGNYSLWKFQAGRLIGYASLGAIAASSVKSLAWFSSQTLALHPLWTFFHVLIFSWGLVLFAYARQPMWADKFSRQIWKKVNEFSKVTGSVMVTGIFWAFMPCGLLYSALLVASLSTTALNGALSMATFAIGSSISLILGPWIWLKMQRGGQYINESASMRIAGLLLSATAGWAIWMDLMKSIKIWCN